VCGVVEWARVGGVGSIRGAVVHERSSIAVLVWSWCGVGRVDGDEVRVGRKIKATTSEADERD
jgi:hypothetical protein